MGLCVAISIHYTKIKNYKLYVAVVAGKFGSANEWSF